MFNKHKKRVMFVGDNHVEGFKDYFERRYPKHHFEESIKDTDTIYDLKERFKDDVLKAKPEIVVISIGTNDVNENRNSVYMGTTTSMQRYEILYREILTSLFKAGIEHIILIEPFYVSSMRMNDSVRFDVYDKIYVVRKVAVDFGVKILAADGILNQTFVNDSVLGLVGMSGMKLKQKGRTVLMEACEPLLNQWRIR